MYAKMIYSSNASSTLDYIFREGKYKDKKVATSPKLLMTNYVPCRNLRKIKLLMKMTNKNSRSNGRFLHFIIAHPLKDIDKMKEDGVEESQLLKEFLYRLKNQGVNLFRSAFVLVRHADKKDVVDYHLLATERDCLTGKLIKRGFAGSKACKVASDISKDFNLSCPESIHKNKIKAKKNGNSKENKQAGNVSRSKSKATQSCSKVRKKKSGISM